MHRRFTSMPIFRDNFAGGANENRVYAKWPVILSNNAAPEVSVNRARLNFGVANSTTITPAQTVRVNVTSGSPCWTVSNPTAVGVRRLAIDRQWQWVLHRQRGVRQLPRRLQPGLDVDRGTLFGRGHRQHRDGRGHASFVRGARPYRSVCSTPPPKARSSAAPSRSPGGRSMTSGSRRWRSGGIQWPARPPVSSFSVRPHASTMRGTIFRRPFLIRHSSTAVAGDTCC